MRIRWLYLGLMVFIVGIVIAQDSICPALQRDALNAIQSFCTEQESDTLCYGNPTLSVTYIELADDDLRFALPGDSIPLTSIDWLSTSTEANSWGTTRAFMSAYTVDSFQAQPATMVLFGNVFLLNQGTENITIPITDIEVTYAQGANIRALPSSESLLLEPAIRGTILKASGVSDDGAWVRVHTDRDEVGWVNVTAISDDYVDLPTVGDDDTIDELILPFQKFNFQSGISDSPCDGAPPSGILLQTPLEGSPTEFYVNGVRLRLNGTAFLQAHPETGLLIHVINGEGRVNAVEGEEKLNAGYVSRIFLDTDDGGDLYPIEAPTIPLVYDYDSLIDLPIDLLANPTRVALDIYTLITPRPIGGESPIAGMALTAPCKFTVGQTGANIRSEPGPSGDVIAVMGYRESAEPIGRTIGLDEMPWWKLADGVWIRIDTTVTGGDCTSVPNVEFEG